MSLSFSFSRFALLSYKNAKKARDTFFAAPWEEAETRGLVRRALLFSFAFCKKKKEMSEKGRIL